MDAVSAKTRLNLSTGLKTELSVQTKLWFKTLV